MILSAPNLSKFLVIFLFFLSLTLSAQTKENTPLSPAEAKPLIVENWGAKRKTMNNFTLDVLRLESINLVMAQNIPEITRFKFFKGQKDGADIILAVGVDDKGNVYGNYFVTTFTNRVGPCPDTCD
jgi:hypothetical protein